GGQPGLVPHPGNKRAHLQLEEESDGRFRWRGLLDLHHGLRGRPRHGEDGHQGPPPHRRLRSSVTSATSAPIRDGTATPEALHPPISWPPAALYSAQKPLEASGVADSTSE